MRISHHLVTIIICAVLCSTLGYPSDFKTFKIIPSDAKTKYISNYHSELENPILESKNAEDLDASPEHRAGNIPINIIRNNKESVKDVTKKFHDENPLVRPEMVLSIPYPYVYDVNLDSPKSLQIAVEPHENDTKFKITDTFLDSFLKPQPTKTPTTKRPKKPNKNPTNKLPRPNDSPQTRPNKNIKQTVGTDEADEMQENTTSSEPITTQQNSLIHSNDLAGSSQIGNRESQMVLKPTVIVNIRGTVTNSEGELSLESRSGDIEMSTGAKSKTPSRNVFHISQEINIDRKPSDYNEDSPSYVEQKETLERKLVPEQRTIDLVLSSGQNEYHLKERMSIFDDYSDFSLYR